MKFAFILGRPRTLEIKVNNKRYKTVNKINLGYDYSGLVTVFSSLGVFALIENIMFGGMYGFDFRYVEFTTFFLINFILIGIYGTASYLLSKKKTWAYFMGAILFLLTTTLSTTGFPLVFSSAANILILIFRFGLLIYLAIQAKHIVKELRRARKSAKKMELLDDI